MSEEDRHAIESACRTLAIRSFVLIDSREWEPLADLYTEDAVFARPTAPDQPILGRAAILAQYQTRPTSKVTRHFVANALIDVQAGDKAKGLLYVLLFTGTAETEAPSFPIAADPVRLVGEFRDDYILTAEGWRIARRAGNMIFRSG
jgi:ketosteroid isomerase-like protein